MYFDSHAHYDDERFNKDREYLLEALPQQGVGLVVNAAADMQSTYTSLELAKKYDYIYCSIGVHPHEVKELEEKDIEILRKLSGEEKVVAIGEIGLDYYYDFSPREEQRKWFKRQLELAKEIELPVIIHSRDACQETFDIIKESGVMQGVIHCFSGSKELAREYVKRGFYIGIGGSLTFKNAKKTVEVVKEIDLNQILIETDAPYLTPIPYRGERNDSSYLKYVIQKIAEIKGISTEEVESITYANARKMFKI
ncbi:hydrolase TatD [Sporanaerobium hydrogeniformans]|uniref:Hydrolase TatD n=1 Tax=Sporanaerobium hydrogeniformans TaxID=3072179 RepID=A0AC61DC58_9FIRM|nr:TatD family hydrolase [Sporanaerobium hydrogeniformans]PHV70854.1 hydrolase TatD [Sporanaerobium hydrogeniformans]